LHNFTAGVTERGDWAAMSRAWLLGRPWSKLQAISQRCHVVWIYEIVSLSYYRSTKLQSHFMTWAKL